MSFGPSVCGSVCARVSVCLRFLFSEWKIHNLGLWISYVCKTWLFTFIISKPHPQVFPTKYKVWRKPIQSKLCLLLIAAEPAWLSLILSLSTQLFSLVIDRILFRSRKFFFLCSVPINPLWVTLKINFHPYTHYQFIRNTFIRNN